MTGLTRATRLLSISVLMLGGVSCQSAPPSPQTSPEPEPWEKVVAENPLFEDKMSQQVGESLCETASAELNKKESTIHIRLNWDKKNYSCGGNITVPTSSGEVIGSGTLRFSRLTEYEQKDLAQHLLNEDNDTSTCALTDYLIHSSDEGEQTERETTNGEYCYYPYTGDSYPAYGEGRYVASNTAVTAKFETIDDEADPEQLQQGIDELLDLTMEALLAQYPQP